MFRILLPAAFFAAAALSPAAIVWEFGGDGIQTVSFSADGSDPTDPDQQDIISPSVIISRGTFQGIFNVVNESFYQSFGSPTGTRWAFSGLGPPGSENPPEEEFSASNYANLTFESWADALGRNGLPGRSGNLFENIIGTPGVVHLLAEDIYLDIVFTEWGASGQGFWGYERAAGPIPEPGALALLALAALPLLRRIRQPGP